MKSLVILCYAAILSINAAIVHQISEFSFTRSLKNFKTRFLQFVKFIQNFAANSFLKVISIINIHKSNLAKDVNILIKNFVSSLFKFVQNNKWVPAVYGFIIFCLICYKPEKASFFQIFNAIVTSSMHFIADIFIIMMIDAYSISDKKNGSIYQFIAMAIFTVSKLYSGVAENKWLYIAADPAYIVSGFRNYCKDVLGKNFLINKLWQFIIICILCFSGFIVFNSPVKDSDIIFAIGLLIFAMGLFCGENKRLSNVLMIIGLCIYVAISGFNVTGIFRNELPTGLDISHFILPLTVLVYKFKSLTKKNTLK